MFTRRHHRILKIEIVYSESSSSLKNNSILSMCIFIPIIYECRNNWNIMATRIYIYGKFSEAWSFVTISNIQVEPTTQWPNFPDLDDIFTRLFTRLYSKLTIGGGEGKNGGVAISRWCNQTSIIKLFCRCNNSWQSLDFAITTGTLHQSVFKWYAIQRLNALSAPSLVHTVS